MARGNEGQEHVQLEKTTSSMLVTPKKKVNLDVDNLDEVSSVDLQILINQRLQRSRSSSKNIPSRSSSSGKARNQDGSPNSISNTPEGSGSNEFGSGKDSMRLGLRRVAKRYSLTSCQKIFRQHPK